MRWRALSLSLGLAAMAGVLSAQPDRVSRELVGDAPVKSGVVRGVRRGGPVYPVLPEPLPAAHDHPGHVSLACGRCHRLSADRGRAGRMQTPVSTCRECHRSRAPKVDPIVAPTRPRPAPRLWFSHARHAAHSSCDACHARGPDGVRLQPAMATCLDCHEAGRIAQSCGSCHVTDPDGSLTTTFGEQRLVPRGDLFGMAHDRDWLVRHRWVGADHGGVCSGCHTERDCERCHDGRRPPKRIHGGDFLSLHAQQARRTPAKCVTCHTVQRFCSECHARLGLSLGAAPTVGASGRVHPPAAAWLRGPNQHALEARRDLISCTSCHAESDCIACHGARGIGAGFSPHERGFRRRCRALVRQNPRPCVRCHGDPGGLCD